MASRGRPARAPAAARPSRHSRAARAPGAPGRRASTRPPGRPPAGAPDLRQSLLDAARRLFIAKGFGNVGTRELARAAGVSAAMIPYYFGDKQGLYEALVEDAIGQVLARLQKLAAAGASSNESASRRQDPVGAFLAAYLDTLIAEPWIPQLLVREVLAHDSPLRRRFRESFAGPAKQALSGLLVAQTERGRLRADLDVDLAVLSLIGMTVFPFLVHPVLGDLFGYRLDAEFRDRFQHHTRRLFLDGARPRSAS